MPKEKGDKMAVTIWLDKKIVDRVDRLADKGGLTRSKLMANLIEVGSEDVVLSEKLGLWAVARIFRDMADRLKKGSKDTLKIED